MALIRDRFNPTRDSSSQGLCLSWTDTLGICSSKGEFFIRVTDGETGQVLFQDHRENIITYDAGILAAILLRDPASRTRGMNMLAVGTGATGALLSPDAPDPKQRRLNAEIARKAFSSKTFIDLNGEPTSIPTNIVDFTVTFDEGEAVGPLNEMGIVSTISANPAVLNLNPNIYPTRDVTVDVSTLDIFANYLTYSVLSIPATARLSITWRITF